MKVLNGDVLGSSFLVLRLKGVLNGDEGAQAQIVLLTEERGFMGDDRAEVAQLEHQSPSEKTPINHRRCSSATKMFNEICLILFLYV